MDQNVPLILSLPVPLSPVERKETNKQKRKLPLHITVVAYMYVVMKWLSNRPLIVVAPESSQ